MLKDQQIISATKNTPEVILDPEGVIKFSGRLIPENAEGFFNPIVVWINEYFYNPAEITRIEISLEYINSAGIKYLLDIIRKITHEYLHKDTSRFIINWYYYADDEDIIDKGRLFSSNLALNFNFIELSDK